MNLTGEQLDSINLIIENRSSIVPLIGDKAFVVDTDDGPVGFLEYVIRQMWNSYRSDSIRSIRTVSDIYYLATLLKKDMTADRFSSRFRSLARGLSGKVRLKDSILEFLRELKPDLIVTTSPFAFIEENLSRLGMAYESLYYNPKTGSRGIDKPVIGENGSHTVYHLFGKAADGHKWVYDEDTLLEFLHAVQGGDYSCSDLFDYLGSHGKRVMVLESDLPDWVFRFLWYPFWHADRENRLNYWFNNNGDDSREGFIDFLRRVNFETESEVDMILSEITSGLRADNVENSVDNNPKDDEEYFGFISYASEDAEIARRIYRILTAQNKKIWFDDVSVKVGDNYVDRYKKGITQAKFYIPVVTEHFINKMFETSHVKEELNAAKAKAATLPASSPYSLPVIIDGRRNQDNDLITTTMVENIGRYSVPSYKELFYHINMLTLPENFTDIKFD